MVLESKQAVQSPAGLPDSCPSPLFCNLLIRFLLSERISVMSLRNAFHSPPGEVVECGRFFMTMTFWFSLFALTSPFPPPLPSAPPFFPFLFVSSLSSPPQRFVPRTVEGTASVSEAPAAARRAGWARPVISERVTRAATSTGPAARASVNAARAGTESTAPLVGGKATQGASL